MDENIIGAFFELTPYINHVIFATKHMAHVYRKKSPADLRE
jgi:hypothetical protein